MTTGMHLAVLTPERSVLSTDAVTRVRLRLADDAWISIYPNHAPLIAETYGGPLEYDTDGGSDRIDLAPGILHIGADQVLVLTSGLARESTSEAAPGTGEPARFDRLASQLMRGLNAEPSAAVAESDADEL